MAVLTASDEQSLNEFMKNIDSVGRIMKTSSSIVYRVIKVYMVAFFVVVENTRSFKTLRSISESCNACNDDCSPKECAARVLEISKRVREEISSTRNELKPMAILAPLSILFEKLLIDWDDFVVDLTISSDPEIEASIGQLIDVL